MITFYRGDGRKPEEIKAAGGFTVWPEAQELVDKAGGVDSWMYTHLFLAYKNNRDVQRYIITGRSRARPTISTSKNDGCGGYDAGYIYRIDFAESDLSLVPLTPGVMSYPTTHDMKMLGGQGMELYIDSDRLRTSTVVGLDLKVNTEEVAFFTKIPAAKITAYRDARTGGSSFQPMP